MNIKKNVSYLCIVLISVLVMLVLSVYFYCLGIQNKYSLFPTVLPKLLVNTNSNRDMRIESFNIVSTYKGEEVTLPSRIVLPDFWYFEEISNNSNFKQYVISDFSRNLKLIITPKRINKSRSIKSVTTKVTVLEKSSKEYVADYLIEDSDQFEAVSIYRAEINENEMKYVQKVESKAQPEEAAEVLNEFIVFNRQEGFYEEDSFVWIADIRLKLDESLSQKEKDKYIEIVNDIVSSLQVRE